MFTRDYRHTWGALALGIVCISGCGRYGFDPQLDGEGDGGVDATPDRIAVRALGNATCAETTSEITLTESVPAGSVVVVHVVARDSAAAVSVTDSASNTYALSMTAGDDTLRLHVLTATLVAGLAPGDRITATHSSSSATVVTALEVSGVAAPPSIVASGSGSDRNVTVPFSFPSSGIAYCAIGMRNGVFAVEGPWILADMSIADCGGAVRGAATLAYWLPASAGGVSSCDGVIDGAIEWRAAVASFAD